MVWFFERRGQYLRCEVRQALEGPAYELRVRYPDAQTQVERIQNPTVLIERIKETQGRLCHDGWTMAGSLDL